MKRPLRWLKFCFGLALLSTCWSAVLPRLEAASPLLRSPYVDSPAPLLPAALAALLCLLVAGWLLADLLWGRRMPRAILPTLVGGLLAPGLAAGLGSAPPSPPPTSGEAQLRALLSHLAHASACTLDRTGTIQAEAATLREEALRRQPKTSFQSRLGLHLAPRIRILREAEGPVFHPLAGDAPGTLYLAIAANEQVAWWTALGLGEAGPVLLREEGRVLVETVFPAAQRNPPCAPARAAP